MCDILWQKGLVFCWSDGEKAFVVSSERAVHGDVGEKGAQNGA